MVKLLAELFLENRSLMPRFRTLFRIEVSFPAATSADVRNVLEHPTAGARQSITYQIINCSSVAFPRASRTLLQYLRFCLPQIQFNNHDLEVCRHRPAEEASFT
jgi:hypothetical protein